MIIVPLELAARAAGWAELKRWERRELAVELRVLGLSIKEIARIIPASRGSISVWCRDIVLSEEQRARLTAKRPEVEVRRAIGERRRRRRLEEVAEIRCLARHEAGSMRDGPEWVAGVVAYWAEGSKGSEIQFANSDSAMIQLFMRWTRRYLDGDRPGFTAQLHLHSGQDEVERKFFWSSIADIPVHRSHKTFVKQEGTGHRKKLLYNGTISIRMKKSTDGLHRVLRWIEEMAAHQGAAHDATVVYNPRASTGR